MVILSISFRLLALVDYIRKHEITLKILQKHLVILVQVNVSNYKYFIKIKKLC